MSSPDRPWGRIARASAAGMPVLLCAAPLLSRTPDWGPGELALLGLMLVFWAGLYERQVDLTPHPLPPSGEGSVLERALIAGLFAWLAVSALASPQVWRGLGYAGLTMGCVLCGALARGAHAHSRRLSEAAVWGGAWVSVWGVAEYYGLWTPPHSFPGRIVGAFTNPNDLGVYLCAVLPPGCLLLLSDTRPWRKAVVLAATVLSYTGLLMSGSRGAWWAGLCAGGVMVAAGWRAGLWGALRENRGWALALAGMVAGVTVLYSVPGPFKAPSAVPVPDRFISSGELAQGVTRPGAVSGTSVGHRYLIWQAAAVVIAERPVLGVGPGGFEAVYPEVRDRVLRGTGRFDHLEPGMRREDVRHAHNDYLQAAAESGLPGLFLFIGVIGLWAGRAWRQTGREETVTARALKVGYLAAAAAILTDATVSYPLHIPAVAVLFWSFLGMAMGGETYPLDPTTCRSR